MSSPRFAAWKFSVALMVAGAGIASGADYPNKPIRIVTANPGGGSDFAARLIAQGISGPLGQPVIVENRGGLVTAEIASRAAPDGYTMSLNGANLWVTTLLRKSPYDVLRDFAPISLLLREVAIAAVNPSVPVRSINELIAMAKARPGELNLASDAPGGTSNLAGELFKSMAGVKIVNVPYKGAAAGITALISGEVQLMIVDAGLLAPHVKSGKLRALAVTSAEPTALAAGLPTVAASGLPGYEAVGMTGMFAPAKTPAAIINRLNREIVRMLNRPEVKEQFFVRGSEVVASSPAQFDAAIKADIARKSKVIKDAGIKLD